MYSAETRAKALSLLQSGLTPPEVSRQMGGRPSKTTIRMWASGFVPAGKRAPRREFSLDDKLTAIKRVQSGKHYAEVAHDIDVAPSTLLMWKRQYAQHGIEGISTYRDIREYLHAKLPVQARWFALATA